MAAPPINEASAVTAWVKLEKAGASFEVVDVVMSLDASVSTAREKVFQRMPVALHIKEVDPSQVKLFLSDEDSIDASSPARIGALRPYKSLRSEVVGLNPAWTFPSPLFLLAVAEGACVWRRGGHCLGRSIRDAHPPPPL